MAFIAPLWFAPVGGSTTGAEEAAGEVIKVVLRFAIVIEITAGAIFVFFAVIHTLPPFVVLVHFRIVVVRAHVPVFGGHRRRRGRRQARRRALTVAPAPGVAPILIHRLAPRGWVAVTALAAREHGFAADRCIGVGFSTAKSAVQDGVVSYEPLVVAVGIPTIRRCLDAIR